MNIKYDSQLPFSLYRKLNYSMNYEFGKRLTLKVMIIKISYKGGF